MLWAKNNTPQTVLRQDLRIVPQKGGNQQDSGIF